MNTQTVDPELLATFRKYLPEGATVYSMDANPRGTRNYLKFYCAHEGHIMRLTGMIANIMGQLGYSLRLDSRTGALITGEFYDYQIVDKLSFALYGRYDALKVGSL